MSGQCRSTPGERFDTRDEARGAIGDRRINIALNGGSPVAEDDYVVKGCDCSGFHLMTKAQLAARRRRRGR